VIGAAASNSARPRLQEEDGFTLIELVVAVAILTIGILGMFMGFISAQKLNLVNERHATLVHIAQQSIEQIEGVAYSQVGLTSAPSTSTDPTNPDYYVTTGSPAAFKWDRTSGASESLDVDATNGTVQPVQSWGPEGALSGQVYSFVTWTADPKCAPGCPSTQDYKRVTVAVTVSGGLQPNPVWVSSIIADPQAEPVGGIQNGSSGNPLTNPSTTCTNGSGVQVSCTSPIDSGNPNTFFLHDWAATNTGTPQPPSADNATHPTVGVLSGLLCTTLPLLAGLLSNIAGCPVPDLMDANPPSALPTSPLYHYSTDQASDSTYPGGRLLQPLCSAGLCSGNSGGGTGQTSDCSNNGLLSNLLSVQSQFWVSSPVTATTTLTGDAGLSMFTQSVGGVNAIVSFCIEIYDIPPAGGSSGLGDILAFPPVALGGAGYVAPTDPATGGNWPTTPTNASFIFNFRGSGGTVSIAAGHRLGVRIWVKVNLNAAIDLLYDHPLYPSQVQLNTQ
jgi:prepilin-type N-terminal cleavage/methylation domain-containing protein